MLVNGDKLVVTKNVASFLKEGDIVKVIDVSENGMISFAFGDGFVHKGLMSETECNEHFKKYEEPKLAPTVSQETIEEIMNNSEITVQTVFDKCTIVSCKLPNGFVIVESAACVSPENYDEEIGIDICLQKIENKVWELEAYKLQSDLCEKDVCPCECECGECLCGDDCEYDEDEEYEDEDDYELDCYNCDDYNCPENHYHRI